MKSIKLKDKLMLLLTGLLISSVFLFGMIFFGEIISVKQIYFILMSIGYLVMLSYAIFGVGRFKQIPKVKLLLFQSVFYIVTVSVAYLIFTYKLLPIEYRFGIYGAIIIVLSMSAVALLDFCVKKMKFFRNDKKSNDGSN